MFTKQTYPERWEGIQNNIALANNLRPGNKPTESRDSAPLPSQQKEDEKLRQGNSKVQAALHMFQGNPLLKASKAAESKTLAKQSTTFSRHWMHFHVGITQTEWASTQNCLGEAYGNLVFLAIGRKFRSSHFPLPAGAWRSLPASLIQIYWAAVHNNLGIAYANGASGDQAENAEQAIQYCQQALEVYTRNAIPDDWAMTQNNLGNAFPQTYSR